MCAEVTGGKTKLVGDSSTTDSVGRSMHSDGKELVILYCSREVDQVVIGCVPCHALSMLMCKVKLF